MKKEDAFFLVASLYSFIFLAFIASALSDFSVPANITGNEDALFVYNLTANLSSQSWSENLLFSIVNISAANYTPNFAGAGYTLAGYPWISFNSSTGIFTINSTSDNQTAVYTAWMVVTNGSGQSRGDSFQFNISPVNDAPIFQSLSNQTFNMTELFTFPFSVVDEENNVPFNLSITFVSCSVAQWSTRNCSTAAGRQLFDSGQYTFNPTTGAASIYFTPSRNDVGSYIILFNATDSGSASAPFNNSAQQMVNFTVNAINSPPKLNYVCDNERAAAENSNFICLINASDEDEVNNLTFRSTVNITRAWLTFNSSGTSIEVVPVNITTQFNGTAIINFTPDDSMVGTWTVNISVNDTGSPSKSNSTTFSFTVSNVADAVLMDNLSAQTIYTSNNYTGIYATAYDDDLLVPDKAAVNEVLTFYSNDSRVYVQTQSISANRTIARISMNGSAFSAGTHMVNISVNDTSNLHTNSSILMLDVLNNTAPEWINGTGVNLTLTEDAPFIANLTQNVTDADGSPLTFTYVNFSMFTAFSLNGATGVMSFTPRDSDVGKHHVLINVTDGISSVPLSFTFTVSNINDTPAISEPLTKQQSNSTNFTLNALTSDITTGEDNYTSFKLRVIDMDFNITQRSYYNESLNISTNISGPNPSLFSFASTGLVPLPSRGLPSDYSAQQDFIASFTPNKTDTGNYTINVTVRDSMGLSDSLLFNITILTIQHAPTLQAVSNKTSAINRTLTFDLIGADTEDGNDATGNLTYNYTFMADGLTDDFIMSNASRFNTTSGLLNVTFNDSQQGKYHLNFSVTDLVGSKAYADTWISVYGMPNITSPAAGTVFNLTENTQAALSFNATHPIGDNVTYMLYLNGSLRHSANSTSGLGLSWLFTPNLTDETYGAWDNITLTAIVSQYPEFNVSRSFYANISHANAPVVFNGSIPNAQANYGQQITVNMESFMYDLDSIDTAYNQTLYFTVRSNMSSNSTITASISNGSIANNSLTLIFTASAAAFETFNVSVNDSEYENVSNTFTIQFTTPTVQQGAAQSSSSGGGGSTIQPVSLNIIVPGTFTSRKQDKLIVPISVHNTGTITLSGITLRNVIAKNGLLREDLIASFDRSTIKSLQPNQKENLTLIIDVDTTEAGLYEVTLNGTSSSPKYSDTSKLYINVEEGDTVSERIAFTEEFLAQNPQCVEITEMIDEAKELYSSGDVIGAQNKAEDALSACKKAISQASRAQVRKQAYSFVLDNSSVIAAAAILAGIGYYWIRRMRMQRATAEAEEPIEIIK